MSDDSQDKENKDTGLKGKTVWWEKRGLGKGETAKGEVLAEVPSGTTNREAMDQVRADHPYAYRYRTSYEKFDPETVESERVIVAVEKDTDHARPIFHFYAPNALDVVPV